jgi:hypothetical protein
MRLLPPLLGLLVGVLIGMSLRAWMRGRVSPDPGANELLVWTLVLASFALGAFATFVLLRP